MTRHTAFPAVALLVSCFATPLRGQAPAAPPDPLVAAAKDAAAYMRAMFIASAEQMTEQDYEVRPTPEVRSFGELLAHVAESNYQFCAAARGETPPAASRGLEKTATTPAAIRQMLTESFNYCDAAYAAAEGERGRAMVTLMGQPRPVLAVLLFRTHHTALHYGNAITYMRLRGKVPPSTTASSSQRGER